MRYIKLENCVQGMVLAKNVYGSNGALLLRRGVVITQKQLDALLEVGYAGIYIHDEASDGLVVPETVDTQTRNAANAAVEGLFSATKMTQVIKQLHLVKAIEELLQTISDQIKSHQGTVHNIVSLKTYDSYTYQHCVDVSIICIVIGKTLNMNDSTLVELGKAAMLHDIGKMFLPKEILSKPSKLTPSEFMEVKKHSQLGYDCVKYALTQPETVCRGVLLHHEQSQGGGYPKGVSSDKIPLFAKIIAVADVYDAITSKRPYKNAMVASEAYEYIMSNSGRHFDTNIVDVFIRNIAPYPVGSTVILSDERKALVINNNAAFMMRPLIKILKNGKQTEEEYIDMALDANARNVTIVGTM